jgi:ligand-binding sensor domain-containing protein
VIRSPGARRLVSPARALRATCALCAALVLASMAGCGAAGTGAGAGRRVGLRGGSGAREERVVITNFAEVTGIAVSQRLVFVTSTSGLAIYDRLFDAWQPPVTVAEGFPVDRVTALAADPSLDGVWVGSAGAVTLYRPSIELVTRAPLPGIVDVIAFDRRDLAGGALVRASGQWLRVSSSGFASPLAPGQLPPASQLVVSSSLQQVYAEYPGLQAFERLLLRDDRMRSYQVTAGAKAPDRSEVWLGTFGGGVFEVDPVGNQATPRPFGLLGPGAGAIALAADGVWIAGDGGPAGGRSGLTFTSDDLQEWRWLDGGTRSPYAGGRAYDIDVRESRAWVATSRGLVEQTLRGADDARVYTQLDGLPSDFALSVAARADGAWVGTQRGLAFVGDSGGRRGRVLGDALLAGVAVRGLAAIGDSLWVASDAGLVLVRMSTGAASRPAIGDPRALRPVRAVSVSDSILAFATAEEALRLNLRTGALVAAQEVADPRVVGGVMSLALDDRTLWSAGARGVLVTSRAGGASRFLSVPTDLPDEAYDVTLTPEFAWIATRAGVVRLRRLSDGTVR